MKEIVIIGAGGVGKETALLIEQINSEKPTWHIVEYLDDNRLSHGTYVNNYKVLGGTDLLCDIGSVFAVCAIANYQAKLKILEKIKFLEKVKGLKIKFANIIHPSVYISSTNTIGEGCIIYPGVIMSTNIKIGNHVIISPKCGIGHDAVIGDYCSILWNVNISGFVTLGEGVMMGSGSTIIQNKSIGRASIVGAGATVIDNLPEYCTAVGVPARVIKFNM